MALVLAAASRVQQPFVGSAFQAPAGADALLLLPRRTISLMPRNTDGPPVFADAPRESVGQWQQGAVLNIGKGRVAVFGETGLFSAGPAGDNRMFVLNVVRWLTRVL